MASDDSQSNSSDTFGGESNLSVSGDFDYDDLSPYQHIGVSELAASLMEALDSYKEMRQDFLEAARSPAFQESLYPYRSTLVDVEDTLRSMRGPIVSAQATAATMQEAMMAPETANALATAAQIDPQEFMVDVEDILGDLRTPALSMGLGRMAVDYQLASDAAAATSSGETADVDEWGIPDTDVEAGTSGGWSLDVGTAQRIISQDLPVENGEILATVAIFTLLYMVDNPEGFPLSHLSAAFVLAQILVAGGKTAAFYIGE